MKLINASNSASPQFIKPAILCCRSLQQDDLFLLGVDNHCSNQFQEQQIREHHLGRRNYSEKRRNWQCKFPSHQNTHPTPSQSELACWCSEPCTDASRVTDSLPPAAEPVLVARVGCQLVGFYKNNNKFKRISKEPPHPVHFTPGHTEQENEKSARVGKFECSNKLHIVWERTNNVWLGNHALFPVAC